MASQMKSIKLNWFTSLLQQQTDQTQSPESSPTDLITLIPYHLNQWLTDLTNFFTPETRARLADHWLMIAAGTVLLLCFMCCCLPAILRCFTWVLVGCFNLIKGFFMMFINAIKSVFRCLCCCGARSGKMMTGLFITILVLNLNFTSLFPISKTMANQMKSIKLNWFTSFLQQQTVSMANQMKSIKLNWFTSFLQQQTVSMANQMKSIKLNWFTSFLQQQTVSMANQMKSIKLNWFTSFLQQQTDETQSPESSPTDLITLILYHLNQWLTSISNLFTTLFSDLTNFFTPETRALLADHWLMIAAGTVLLLFFMCCCLPAILRCIVWVLVTCFNLIKGLFMMLFNAIKSVFRCLCCCARSGKMMKAPGTAGRLFIPRASFEINPAAYFQNLRATPLLSNMKNNKLN